MNWKNYSALKGTHAFLSPSKYYWLRYDDAKLIDKYLNYSAATLGTKLHELAANLISLSVRLPDVPIALNMFVNDAIGFGMDPEVVLYYSVNCYGTADAISWKNGVLRIHDLKTGVSPASMDQLMVYAGLFCLDYGIKASSLNDVFLAIYQNDEVITFNPHKKDVFDVSKRIIEADNIIKKIEEDGFV